MKFVEIKVGFQLRVTGYTGLGYDGESGEEHCEYESSLRLGLYKRKNEKKSKRFVPGYNFGIVYIKRDGLGE